MVLTSLENRGPNWLCDLSTLEEMGQSERERERGERGEIKREKEREGEREGKKKKER